ncbi:hypothetical protein ACFE04_010568 [Oxalis oulophora]
MQENEQFDNDLADDADYAASIQIHQGSTSMIIRTDSDMTSSSPMASNVSGSESLSETTVEIVYVKDNVAIHPTQFASERISGRLKLLKQASSVFLTWIPYKGQTSNPKLTEKAMKLYMIRAMPFTDVRSICRHTPSLGWQYVIVVLKSGLAYPPFYFYNGGVREFLATIKQHIFLVRSSEDANVFLVNELQNPLQRTLSSFELPLAVSTASSQSPSAVGSPSHGNHGGIDSPFHDVNSNNSQLNGMQRHKSLDPARDISIQVLEKFSLVTKFARETTNQIFREIPPSNGFDRNNYSQCDLEYPDRESIDEDKVYDQHPVPADPLEFDKLSITWGKLRQHPLSSEEWATMLDSEGRIIDSEALRKRIFYGGVEHQLRKEIWGFLLEHYAYDSTYAEREYLKVTKKSEYESLKNQWQSVSPEQAKRFTKFRERKGLIDKDVVRTDRSVSFYDGDDNPNVKLLRDILMTHSFYNFDLGYCQGMSDLLSPILCVLEDESESFWCFVGLMERLGANFNRDQNGMHAQLFAISKLVELLDSPLHDYFKQKDCLNYFFCFRWVLIQFKREFEYDKIMRLWEVLWTHCFSEHMHLYICVAILKRWRSKIIGEQMDFDALLQFINQLSGNIDLDSTLRDAEALCVYAGEEGAARIPPGTPPSLQSDSVSYDSQQDDLF